MSLNACEGCFSVFFFNRDIHNHATLGPDVFQRFDALVRKEISHRVDDEFLFTVFCNRFGWFNDVWMSAENDIGTPFNHLVIRINLSLSWMKVIFFSHLWQHNRKISNFFSALDELLHPLHIQIV